MNTAQQVKDMANSLSYINSQLCACVGISELLPVQKCAERQINQAYGMKSRSKEANQSLHKAIENATKAMARSQVGHEMKRQREHVK